MPRVREDEKIIKMSLKELQALSHFMTGHGLYRRHLRNWNDMENGDQCSLCGEADEDTWHLWEWCPSLRRERIKIRNEMRQGLSMERGIIKMVYLKQLMSLRARNEALLGEQAHVITRQDNWR